MHTDEPFDSELLQFTFDRIKEVGWNPDEDLLWGYFFVDSDVEKLEGLGRRLESLGYRFVETFELARDDGEKPSGAHMLHVEKVETHSPATLARRNVELVKLAQESGVQAYDGWDVGPVE